jgi:hypothetical protein
LIRLGLFCEEDFAVLTDFDATADFVGNADPPNPETSRRRSPRRSAETPRALLHDINSVAFVSLASERDGARSAAAIVSLHNRQYS